MASAALSLGARPVLREAVFIGLKV